MGFADLHIHTSYSKDGTASVTDVLQRAKEVELDVIAITDHDEIRGALEAQNLASKYGVEVISGIEITTAEGDLLALFVDKLVAPYLSLEETVLRVGELGGICIAPHPMDNGFKMHSLGSYPIMKALRNPDVAEVLVAIETYNATTLNKENNRYADILANRLEIAKTGSSDAHILRTIGLGGTIFPGYSGQDLLTAFRNRTTVPHVNEDWNAVKILGSWSIKYIEHSLSQFKANTLHGLSSFAWRETLKGVLLNE